MRKEGGRGSSGGSPGVQRAEQGRREVRSGWGLRAMSLALILGGERDQVGVFQCPLATMGRLAGIWQEEGRRPLKGTKVGVLVQRRGPLWNVL